LKCGEVLQNWQEIVKERFSWKRTICQVCTHTRNKERIQMERFLLCIYIYY